MNRNIIFILIIFFSIQLNGQSKQWALWRELPQHSGAITFLHSHQKQLYVGDKNGQVYVYRVDGQGYQNIHKFAAHEGEVSHIEVNPKGDQVVTAGYDGWVRIYDTKEFLLKQEYKNAKVEDYDGTKGQESTFAVYSKDGSSLYIGGYNRHLVKVDITTKQSDIVYFDSTYAITSGELLPHYDMLAFGLGGEVKFLDLRSEKVLGNVFGEHGNYNDYICELAYVPHRDLLSVWLVSGSVQLYNLRKSELLGTLEVSNQQGSCRVGVSPDGNYLATGNAPDVSIVNLKSQNYQQRLTGHQKTVSVSCFSPNGQLLATGSNDGKVFLWKKGNGNRSKLDFVLKGVPSKFKVGEVFVLENLQFDRSSYALRRDATKELDELVKVLRYYKRMEIVLEGHTSNEGDDTKNMTLSKQRVESARNYLIAKGISAERVMVKAFGEKNPRADNSTIAGRIANRRIEMRISKL